MSSPFSSAKRTAAYSTSQKPLERRQKVPLNNISADLFSKTDSRPNFQSIIKQKTLTFLFMMSRRQRIINQEKELLFSQNKINVLRLFNFIDCENVQYIDAENLAQYFPNNSMIALLYGNANSKGRIKFCDFVRMLVPIEYNISLVQSYENEAVDLLTLEKIIRIFKLISDNEKQNLEQLNKLKKQLKLDSTSRLFESIFINHRTLDYETVVRLYQQNNLPVNEAEVSLLFFKMDKNGDGILEPTDFQGYC